MKVSFVNTKVEKQCNDPINEFRWDSRLIHWIQTRMRQIDVAEHLLDIKRLRDLNFHPLDGNRKYQIAIDTFTWGKRWKYRIIFTLPEEYKDVFKDMNNDHKLKKVKEIIILEIAKNHYK